MCPMTGYTRCGCDFSTSPTVLAALDAANHLLLPFATTRGCCSNRVLGSIPSVVVGYGVGRKSRVRDEWMVLMLGFWVVGRLERRSV